MGIESASDVHLRNAMILQTYPHYIYFSSLRTVALSISSYDEFRWIQEHQDYSRLKQRCRQKFLQETVTKTLVLRPSVVLTDLTDQVKMIGDSAVAHGSFSDVWKGQWNDPVERRTRFVSRLLTAYSGEAPFSDSNKNAGCCQVLTSNHGSKHPGETAQGQLAFLPPSSVSFR